MAPAKALGAISAVAPSSEGPPSEGRRGVAWTLWLTCMALVVGPMLVAASLLFVAASAVARRSIRAAAAFIVPATVRSRAAYSLLFELTSLLGRLDTAWRPYVLGTSLAGGLTFFCAAASLARDGYQAHWGCLLVMSAGLSLTNWLCIGASARALQVAVNTVCHRQITGGAPPRHAHAKRKSAAVLGAVRAFATAGATPKDLLQGDQQAQAPSGEIAAQLNRTSHEAVVDLDLAGRTKGGGGAVEAAGPSQSAPTLVPTPTEPAPEPARVAAVAARATPPGPAPGPAPRPIHGPTASETAEAAEERENFTEGGERQATQGMAKMEAATGPAAAEGEDTVKEDEAAARAVEEAEVKVAAKAALEAEIAETKAAIDELRPKLVETQAKAAAAEAEDTAASGTAGAATEATALAAQQSELAELEHSLEEAVAKFVALDGASAGKKCCAGKPDTEEQKQAKAAKAKTKAAAETAPPKTQDDAQRATAAGGTEDKAAAGDKRAGKKKCCAGKPDAEERQPPAVVAAAKMDAPLTERGLSGVAPSPPPPPPPAYEARGESRGTGKGSISVEEYEAAERSGMLRRLINAKAIKSEAAEPEDSCSEAWVEWVHMRQTTGLKALRRQNHLKHAVRHAVHAFEARGDCAAAAADHRQSSEQRRRRCCGGKPKDGGDTAVMDGGVKAELAALRLDADAAKEVHRERNPDAAAAAERSEDSRRQRAEAQSHVAGRQEAGHQEEEEDQAMLDEIRRLRAHVDGILLTVGGGTSSCEVVDGRAANRTAREQAEVEIARLHHTLCARHTAASKAARGGAPAAGVRAVAGGGPKGLRQLRSSLRAVLAAESITSHHREWLDGQTAVQQSTPSPTAGRLLAMLHWDRAEATRNARRDTRTKAPASRADALSLIEFMDYVDRLSSADGPVGRYSAFGIRLRPATAFFGWMVLHLLLAIAGALIGSQ